MIIWLIGKIEASTLSQLCHFVRGIVWCIITTHPPIVYGSIDLGLPSGTKWAAQNVGASKPSEYGLYFQWGDTVGYTADQVGTGNGQKEFTWSDYKWYLGINDDGNQELKKYDNGETLE